MNTFLRKALFFCIFFGSFGIIIAETPQWQLAKDKNGIQVYTRKSDSGLKDSKAVMTIKADAEDIVSSLIDFPEYINWIPKCKSSKGLEKINDNAYIYYNEFAAPMVSNRDMIAHLSVQRESNGFILIEITNRADYIAPKKGLVRIPEFYATWKLTPKADGLLQVVNEYSADPGGSLPSWLVNTASVDNPYNTFRNLKAKVAR